MRKGFAPPDTEVEAVARIERAGIVVKVIIAKDDGQAEPPKAEVRLTRLMRDALEAAPSRLHNPVSVKRLAALSGYSYNSHFRDSVNRLVDLGLLVKLTGGVRRP